MLGNVTFQHQNVKVIGLLHVLIMFMLMDGLYYYNFPNKPKTLWIILRFGY